MLFFLLFFFLFFLLFFFSPDLSESELLLLLFFLLFLLLFSFCPDSSDSELTTAIISSLFLLLLTCEPCASWFFFFYPCQCHARGRQAKLPRWLRQPESPVSSSWWTSRSSYGQSDIAESFYTLDFIENSWLVSAPLLSSSFIFYHKPITVRAIKEKYVIDYIFFMMFYLCNVCVWCNSDILWSSGKGQARKGKGWQGMALKAKGLKA